MFIWIKNIKLRKKIIYINIKSVTFIKLLILIKKYINSVINVFYIKKA